MRSHFSRRHSLFIGLLLIISLLCSSCGFISVTPPIQNVERPADSSFSVYFLDVEQGDCALILCDGEAMLIDGGESDQSSKVYSVLSNRGITHLNYLIATHPHSDHIGGLSGALQVADVDTALSPVTSYDSKQFSSLTKYISQSGVTLTVPRAGDRFSLGSAQVQVIGPVTQTWEDINDSSIVLKITYGKTSFLFTGDMETTSEKAVLEAGFNPSADVLKVAHHGSSSSTSRTFLDAVNPSYAVISVGTGNSYGHPTDEVLRRLEASSIQTYRTDLHGDIHCTSDGQTVTFSTEKRSSYSGTAGSTAGEDITYIGNTTSQKFHLPTCFNLPDEKNRILLESYQAALNAGYSPCSNCMDP